MLYNSRNSSETYKNENINNSNSYNDNIKIDIDELLKNKEIDNIKITDYKLNNVKNLNSEVDYMRSNDKKTSYCIIS